MDVFFEDEPGSGKRGIMLQYPHGAQVPRIKIAQTALYYNGSKNECSIATNKKTIYQRCVQECERSIGARWDQYCTVEWYSRSPYILFSIFRISNGLRYGHKQTLSIYYNI